MRFRHDPDGARLPIKLDCTSNGEYAPIALDPAAHAARAEALEAVGTHARKVGLARRAFLVGACGAAATLAAFNRAFARAGRTGGHYEVPKEAGFEPDAAKTVVGGDELIFDVQLHHVNPDGPWRGRGWEGTLRGFPNASCGEPDAIECFSGERMIQDVFLDSDTDVAVLTHVPALEEDNPLDFASAIATRDTLAALDADWRLQLHGRALPNVAGDLERMQRQAAKLKLAAFKTYTQFGPGGGYFLDDAQGEAMIAQARTLGVPRICVHKGIPLSAAGYQYSTCRDVGVVARRHPDMRFLIYHAGFEPGQTEREYRDVDGYGVNTLIRSLRDNGIGPGSNVYAELGSTWRFVMRDPNQAAHLLGKLLLNLGEDNILWGTDSIWYGSPQDQIQAFRAFQISNQFQQQFGYPALTAERKAKILGLNATRVYGLNPKELRERRRRDGIAKRREAYRERRDPHFLAFGPKTRREFLALRRHGEGG
jgi:uncharacterized protein